MRASTLSTAVAVLAAGLVSAQTFTDCDPTKKTCPADAGLGTTITSDFTKGESKDWELATGTTMSYGSQGAEFVIKTSEAPTMSSNKYIMFGKVSVTTKASAGVGIVSSFILESDDLDEIDWEWLGADDKQVESNFFGKGNTTTYDRAIYHAVTDPIGTMTTYTIDWTAESIKWYIGTQLVRTLSYGDALALGGKNYPQTPMRIKMGSWIGCKDAAAAADPKSKGTCDWAGGYVDYAKAPFTMYVQSVTIQDYGCGGDYTYSDMSGSYQSIKSSGTCGSKNNGGSSSSAVTSKSSTASSTASSTSGNILIQTSSSASTFTSSASASSTGTAVANNSSTGTSASTMTTATSSTPAKTSSTGTSSAPAQATGNAAASLKPSSKYGVLDVAVIGLGLGLGYLVM